MNFLFNFLYLPSIVAFQPSYMLTRTSLVYIYENGIAVVVFPVPQAKILCYDFHIFCMNFFFHSLLLHLKTYIFWLEYHHHHPSYICEQNVEFFFFFIFFSVFSKRKNREIITKQYYYLSFMVWNLLVFKSFIITFYVNQYNVYHV